MTLWETNSATPRRDEPGPALAASRDADGRVWLHVLLRGDPAEADDDWARRVAGLALQLGWHASASPRLRPIAPGLAFAGELALERGRTLAAHLAFGPAFGIARPAPHARCHVRLTARDAHAAIVLDPAQHGDLPRLEDLLGDDGEDARLRARLAPGDPRARLASIERALQTGDARRHHVDAPLLEAVRAALAVADAGHDVHGHRARASAWAHELLDLLDARRRALRLARGQASGWRVAWLAAREQLVEHTWRALTGAEPAFAGWLASPHGRPVAARAPTP